MTDTPDIVIRTAEDREAARRYLAEVPHMAGISLVLLTRKTEVPENAATLLLFEDSEDAILWAAVRAKELSSEGIEVYGGTQVRTLTEFPDKRVAVPFKEHRLPALLAMLEW